MDWLFSFLKDIFESEYSRFISFLRKRKIGVGIVVILGIVYYFVRNLPHMRNVNEWIIISFSNTFMFLFTQIFYNIFITIAVLSIIYVLLRQNYIFKGSFKEDFKHGLRSSNWEFYGNWRIDEEANKNILIVTDSHMGGITARGHTWVNYIFEFETKIINECTAFIVRARDISNLVFFQINLINKIRPHFRVNGHDFVLGERDLQGLSMSKNVWYRVKIIINRGNIKLYINDTLQMDEDFSFIYATIRTETQEERLTFNLYPMGRVGFRLYGREKAAFRDIKVTPLS